MRIEQAIFTSARTRHAQGYHLTARSPGIDEETAQALSLWSPSHGGLIAPDLDAVSLNFFPLSRDRLVLARSVYGGPEYSDRGGLQVVTRMLVLDRHRLAGYGNNPLHVARLALALGHLRLGDFQQPMLEPVELPDGTALAALDGCDGREPSESVRQLADRLQAASRVAVIGAEDPQRLTRELFDFTHRHERLDLSFTTGLKPSLHRQFRVQFLAAADPRLRGQLAAQGIECIDLAA